MTKLSATLDKYNLERDMRTDIYNRAYEAVYNAIRKYDKRGIANVLASPTPTRSEGDVE